VSSTLRIDEVPGESRDRLSPILAQSFTGIYHWHARRTLRTVERVRAATQGDATLGLAMCTMLEPGSGYIYYVAVTPSQRTRGIGGLLLDDALQVLRAAGAGEVFACIRPDNTPSLRLFMTRDFSRIRFRELVRREGLRRAARLWMRMVVAPGEEVFRRVCRP
jgi:ribosomal protein S18 acetylase RimI-like enzyme